MNILPVARLFFSVRLRAAYTRLATGVPQRRHTPRPLRGSIVAMGYTLLQRDAKKQTGTVLFISRKSKRMYKGTMYKVQKSGQSPKEESSITKRVRQNRTLLFV